MNARIKTASKLATVAVALLLTLGVLTSSPAQAAEASNGLPTRNGWALNGWALNGLSPRIGLAAIWAAHGIDLRQPLSAAVERVGR